LFRGKSLSILGTNFYMAEAEEEEMRDIFNLFSQTNPESEKSE